HLAAPRPAPAGAVPPRAPRAQAGQDRTAQASHLSPPTAAATVSRGSAHCTSGPIASAYAPVPTPTDPPSTNPIASAVSSNPVRTVRTDGPRLASPVIRPSLGPGPRPAPM